MDNSKHRLVIALGAIQPIVLGVAVDQKEQIASLKRLLEAKSERRWARDNAIRGDIERLAHHVRAVHACAIFFMLYSSSKCS